MELLPRLRVDLDFFPSDSAEHPGLVIRDPLRYSDSVLVIPPVLVPCLALFDGEHSRLDLKELLVRITGQLQVSELEESLLGTLQAAGFLEDERFELLKRQKEQEFAGLEQRMASHAGAAYPDEPEALKRTLSSYLDGGPQREALESLVGVAAPHVSPWGGADCYRAAYTALSQQHKDKTFVILGTSHYGPPGRFGLTRKPFATPLGLAQTDQDLVEKLARQPAAIAEDYHQAIEHSIEFQVIFLQHLFGPDVRIVPILCGSFFLNLLQGKRPEEDKPVARFFDQLAEIGVLESHRLIWILGIDLAHMGRRYGDQRSAFAFSGWMNEIAQQDRQRLDRIAEGDREGFWEMLGRQDELRWCGSAPLYTFLQVAPRIKAKVRAYHQWQIDPQSVVSFAALSFHSAGTS